jgi:5-methylcytosine-specific restriction endonuclease McrA
MPWKDPERRKLYHAQYRDKNREKIQIAIRKWRTEHPDLNAYAREMNKKNYAKDPAGIQERKRASRKRRMETDLERERNVDLNRSMRRRKICQLDKVALEDWLHVLKLYGKKCLACGADNIERDHVVALSKGGRNVASNLQPLCGTCNRKKHWKTVDYRPFPYWYPEDW